MLSAAFMLAACAQQPVDEAGATAEAGYGRAFGRIEVVGDGEKMALGLPVLWRRVMLFVREVGSERIQHFAAEDDGGFYLPLKAADYILLASQVDRPAAGGTPSPLRLMASFSVPRGKAVYIGDLRIEVEKDRYRYVIADRYAEAAPRTRAKSEMQTAKALLSPEAPPGRQKLVTDICETSWGVACSGIRRGVSPLQPDDTAWNYSPTRTLNPQLAWERVSRSDLAYDVAIYESLTFSYGLSTVRELRGALVAYAEGLREPRWTPPSLQPGRQYQWSVRLRDGDTVSSWSTSGTAFVLPGFAWGTSWGRYFGLATP